MLFCRDPFGIPGHLTKGRHQLGIGLDLGAVRFVEPGERYLAIFPLNGQVICTQSLFEKAGLGGHQVLELFKVFLRQIIRKGNGQGINFVRF